MDPKTTDAKKLLSRKELRGRLVELTEEYRWLSPEASAGHGPAITRRHDIAKELKAVSEMLHLKEPEIDVTLPRSPTGHPYRIGEKAFGAGTHRVRASVAQQLLYMVDQARQMELRRLRESLPPGAENAQAQVDLGLIGDKARFAEINREV